MIIALCMIVILLSKSLLGKAVKNLSIAAEQKQHASSKRASLAVSAPALAVSAAVGMPSSAAAADSTGIQTESSAVAADKISAGH